MNNLDEQIDQILRDWFCNQAEGIIVETETGIHAIQQLLVTERIDELISLSKKQQTFVGYGYDDVGVDISDIDDRIKALQSQLTDGGMA